MTKKIAESCHNGRMAAAGVFPATIQQSHQIDKKFAGSGIDAGEAFKPVIKLPAS